MSYHRVDKVVDLLKEIDKSVLESNDVKNIPGAIDTSNHFYSVILLSIQLL